MGEKSWSELLALALPTGGVDGPHEPTLFVLSNQSSDLSVLPVAGAKGHPVVIATLGERALLVELAPANGVRIADAGGLIDATLLAQLPDPFRVLGAKLAAPLRRHKIGNVAFFHLPGQGALPVMFRLTSTVSRPSTAKRAQGKEGDEVLLRVEALMLNVAHPLIERLAARASSLDATALARAADVLYCVAALNSPLEDVGMEVSDLVVSFLVETLGEGVGPPTLRGGIAHPKCFVALPYIAEFDPVWRALRSVLGDEPYRWEVIRGDEDVRIPDLLAGISAHLASSRRFVADVSNNNPNVMLELGMMLARDVRSTLVLADTEAFKALPADLRGHICLVYPPELRRDEVRLRRWLAEHVTRHPDFIAMRGVAPAVAARAES
jgi:hypothetical protein